MPDTPRDLASDIERVHKAAKELAALTEEDGRPRGGFSTYGWDGSVVFPDEFCTEDGTIYRRVSHDTWRIVHA